MGKYWVYYARNSTFHELDTPKTNEDFTKLDYTFIQYVEAENLEQVFVKMQGDNWSPHGEARELTKALSLHTSMSILDVAKDENGALWMVASEGFTKLPFKIHNLFSL